MSIELEGGCLCGQLRYRVTAKPADAGYCHCRMCQRLSGAPAQVWARIRHDGFAYSQGAPNTYRSSDHGQREFCPTCGSQILFRSANDPDFVSINVPTLDEPNLIAPDCHVYVSSRLDWFRTDDELPEHEAGG